MNIKHFVMILSLACIIFSCNHDHLYYSYGDVAVVRINIDWSDTKLKPNGVSAYAFDHVSGRAVSECVISSKPEWVDIELPMGNYDILVVNDTEYELNNIEFKDIENLNDFCAMITAQTESKFKGIQFKSDNCFISDCDKLAYDIVRNVTIDQIDIVYYHDKPDVNTVVLSKTVNARLQQVTELIDIELEVMNLNSAAGAPRSQLTDLAAGYRLNNGEKHEDVVTHEFVLNNRVIDPDNNKLGRISKKMINFGLHTQTKADLTYPHKLIMSFVLINGETYVVELDVTELIECYHDGFQNVHKIRTSIEIPEVIGSGGGAFDPDIEEWDDIEVDLPI